MIFTLLSPSGIESYSVLPPICTQLDVLMCIAKHHDMGWEVIHIYDYSGLGEEGQLDMIK
jgi:hypothetical protein